MQFLQCRQIVSITKPEAVKEWWCIVIHLVKATNSVEGKLRARIEVGLMCQLGTKSANFGIGLNLDGVALSIEGVSCFPSPLPLPLGSSFPMGDVGVPNLNPIEFLLYQAHGAGFGSEVQWFSDIPSERHLQPAYTTDGLVDWTNVKTHTSQMFISS